jgi:hypothetical protein
MDAPMLDGNAVAESDPYPLAAWLCVAEIEAAKIDCAAYDHERFADVLEEVRGLTPRAPKYWQDRLVELCAQAEVDRPDNLNTVIRGPPTPSS